MSVYPINRYSQARDFMREIRLAGPGKHNGFEMLLERVAFDHAKTRLV